MTDFILNCCECGVSMEVKKVYLTPELNFNVDEKRVKGTLVTECANCKTGAVFQF